MLNYVFPVACPSERCATGGATLEHVNGSHSMRLARTVVQCTGCKQQFLIMVEMTMLTPPGRQVGSAHMPRLKAVAS